MRFFVISIWAFLCPLVASATTITTISMSLAWERTDFYNVSVEKYDTGEIISISQGRITSDEDIWGIPHALSDADLTQPVHFKASFDDTSEYNFYGNSLRACTFAGFDCNLSMSPFYGGGVYSSLTQFAISVGVNPHYTIDGGLRAGDLVRVSEHYPGGSVFASEEENFWLYFNHVSSSFRVVNSTVTIVSHPLPASLMLLPAGIGALAFLRHRRRKLT
jgi:hypothetical protein